MIALAALVLLASVGTYVASAEGSGPSGGGAMISPNDLRGDCLKDGWTCTQKFYNNNKQCIGKVTSPEKHNFTMSSGNTCSNASTCSTKKINTKVVNGKRVCPWSFTYN